MIPVSKRDEPDQFDESVRQRGLAWLERGGEGRPPSYWREALPVLREIFSVRCGYTAMLDRNGTIDHFIAQESDPSLLYEWKNLRYASGWINSSKQDAAGILDPYEVGEGWFEVILPSLQLVATNRVPEDKRELVKSTLSRLPIVNDERVVRQRREWLQQYEKGLSLEFLREYAPLVAAAVEKRDADKRDADKRNADKRSRARTKPRKPTPKRSRSRR